jgi:hypothetical protein
MPSSIQNLPDPEEGDPHSTHARAARLIDRLSDKICESDPAEHPQVCDLLARLEKVIWRRPRKKRGFRFIPPPRLVEGDGDGHLNQGKSDS